MDASISFFFLESFYISFRKYFIMILLSEIVKEKQKAKNQQTGYLRNCLSLKIIHIVASQWRNLLDN